MGKYIRKFGRIGMALGPSEERGFALWVGYDLEGESGDLSHAGLVAVDEWSDEQLLERGVESFTFVAKEDHETRAKLGLT
jgi:hypothetical protein